MKSDLYIFETSEVREIPSEIEQRLIGKCDAGLKKFTESLLLPAVNYITIVTRVQ